MDIAGLSLEGADVLEDGVLMSQLERYRNMKVEASAHHQMQTDKRYKMYMGVQRYWYIFSVKKKEDFLFTNQWVPSPCRNSKNAHNSFFLERAGRFLHACIDLGLGRFFL